MDEHEYRDKLIKVYGKVYGGRTLEINNAHIKIMGLLETRTLMVFISSEWGITAITNDAIVEMRDILNRVIEENNVEDV